MKTCVIFFVSFLISTAFASLPTSVNGADILKTSDVNVSAENKKGLVVVFVSAKCPCSDSHVVELTLLVHDFPDFNFVGVHSNSDEESEMSKAYFEKAKLPFPVIQDQNSKWANTYRALKTPHAFLVRPDGQIAYQGGVSSSRHFEKADRKYLREALTDIQNGRTVKTPEGRTLGCSIRRDEKNVQSN